MNNQKTAVVLRLGGFGDCLWILPVLRALKRDGFRVVVWTGKSGEQVLAGEQCVDEIWVHENPTGGKMFLLNLPTDAILYNLCDVDAGMIEATYQFGCHLHTSTFIPGCPFCAERKRLRDDRISGLNHEDRIVEGWNVDCFPEMEFTAAEREDANRETVGRQWANKFVVIWQQENSAEFKIYPYWFELMRDFVAEHSDAEVYAVGRKGCEFLQVESERIIPITEWSFRKAALMCSRASLVVGVEGALLAGCAFDPVPKLMLMTCSNPYNVAKNWVNTKCIQPRVPCHPCHQLHFQKVGCPLVRIDVEKPALHVDWPVCVGMGFSRNQLLSEMNRIYDKAQQPVGGTFSGL